MFSFEKFLGELEVIAKRESGDRKTQVGACLEGSLNKYGVNHLGCELAEEEIVNRTSLFYSSMIHAEVDMINKLKEENNIDILNGATVFVTLFPCDNCAKALIEVGVKKIITNGFRKNADYHIRAKELLDNAGIEYIVLDGTL